MGLLRRFAPRNDAEIILCQFFHNLKLPYMYCHCEERSDEAILSSGLEIMKEPFSGKIKS